MSRKIFTVVAITLGMIACKNNSQPEENTVPSGPQRFELLSPEKTGVTFSNHLKEDYVYNILNYEYLYNGGGVTVGDINNDGLPDIYFTATFGTNKLYLNKGNMKFEDITDRAGVAANAGFKTGVTMAGRGRSQGSSASHRCLIGDSPVFGSRPFDWTSPTLADRIEALACCL